MARIEEVTVTMTDDLDGGHATETIAFAFDGARYEIDLSRRNANNLRRAIKPYIEAGRKIKPTHNGRGTKGARRTTAASGRSEQYDRAEVRAWAKAHRVKVAPRGRIANEVVERWRQSNGK
jgi:hypothetical protein